MNRKPTPWRVEATCLTGLSDSDLDEFAGNIVVSLTGNTAFHDALLAAAQGGTQLTAVKNEKREVLEDLLRQEGSYVQAIASHNLSTLLSSGFEANSTNRAPSALDAPTIVGLDNGMTTQFILRMQPVANARSYEVQTKKTAAAGRRRVCSRRRAGSCCRV